ncbi:MAG: AtpZ/AtpI family protein [Candidatus Tectimicrobiota bacterium]
MIEEGKGEREELRGKFRALTTFGELLALGFTFAFSIVIGVLVGHYVVDRWLGTSPWGLIVFTLFGIVAGFLNFYRTTKKYIGKGE